MSETLCSGTGSAPTNGPLVPRPFRWVFCGLGVCAAIVPAALPATAESLGLGTEAVLPAVSVLFAGLLLGVVLAPVLHRHLTSVLVLRIATVLQALGLLAACLAWIPEAFLTAAGLIGLGFGLLEVTATAMLRATAGSQTTRALSSMTLWVAASAAVTPIIVLLLGALGWVRLAFLMAALIPVGAAVSFRSPSAAVGEPSASAVGESSVTAPASSAKPAWSRTWSRLLPLAFALICYVGAESILAGWSAAIVQDTLLLPASVAALGTSAFWLLMTSGRALGVWASTHWASGHLLLICTVLLLAALTGAQVTLSSGVPAAASLLFLALAVLAAGPCYSLLLGTAVAQASVRRAVPLTATLVALGAAGGSLIPLAASLRNGSAGAAASTAAIAAAAALLGVLAARPWRPAAVAVGS
ncbi:MFS transporter [Psychromicrobium xiongbiense]|uniref:MFS transporter n=1 Tax=Psychromicrobium xiongbiense TaxID=3051184 RepID=UPI0025567A8A|nr:hypothetical protein [Psychromicrobium sp. YIM S02556]